MKKSWKIALSVLIFVVVTECNPWTMLATYHSFFTGHHRVVYNYGMVPKMLDLYPEDSVISCRGDLKLYPVSFVVFGSCHGVVRIAPLWKILPWEETNFQLMWEDYLENRKTIQLIR